jgi:uncharacterized membrane protein YccF (DUF307 family)
MGRLAARFGAAIWDFLVGDTPEILVVTLAIVGITFAVRAHRSAAVAVLPICSAVALIGAVRYGRTRLRKKRPEAH